MKGGSLLRRVGRLTTLPTRVGQRIGLFDYIPDGLPPGATPPRHTFRWDLDKTYLRTEFDSLVDLARSAIENAADKQAYPGATALLRALRQDGHRICIVSGSPTQMRQVLAAKLALDGVAYDEFVLKNNLKNLLRGRFRSLRAQIPYKLPAMLQSRIGAAADAETLFGDDAEADAIIYCLYADLVAGRVSLQDLERVLTASRAYDDDALRILDLARRVPKHDAVNRLFIHLDRRSAPLGFRHYGPRLVPVFNYFQAAMVLYGDRVLSARQVIFVALEMLDSRQFELSHLATSVQDVIRRGRITREVALQLTVEAHEAARSGALSGRNDLPPFEQIAEAFRDRVRELGPIEPTSAEASPPIDYVRLVDQEHEHRRLRRRHGHS
ncbi:MAG TPA: haloacid dehalogenase-like hydrolase [Kofleriaceae bacterium]|nr:haloacid dehalogenase-like hydrolase [Kofleriaceae bacterium]